MAKNRDAELGDVLDAIESTSTEELRVLRDINKKIGGLSAQNITIQRTNSAKRTPNGSSLEKNIQKIADGIKQRKNSDNLDAKSVPMRTYNRNRKNLETNDAQKVAKAIENITKSATNKRRLERDSRGRFVSPAQIGGNKVNQRAAAPRPPRPGSLYSTSGKTPTKSAQAQDNAEAAAQREAVEEQTKETIGRQDKTNDLLEKLLKEATKKGKDDKKSGGDDDGGGWWPFGRGRRGRRGRGRAGKKPGLFRRMLGRGGKAAAIGAGGLVAGGIAGEVAEAASGTRVRGADGRFVKAGAEEVAGKAGKSATVKLAEKSGMKMLGKGALRAIPILGTALSVGLDAAEGWTDTEAQRAAFGVADGKEVSTRQKTEYTAANIADMGGLVSGASSLIGMGANALGFKETAKAMTFSTADVARGIDGMADSTLEAWDGLKSWMTGDSDDKDKKDEERNDKLLDAIGRLNPQNALGFGYAGMPGVPTDFANDNPAQAAMRNERLTGAAASALDDTRKAQYEGYIQKYAAENNLDPDVVRSVINAESSFNPNAKNKNSTASGLMQLTDAAAKDAARGTNLNPANRFDPETNIALGARYLAQMRDLTDGSTEQMLKAYNQGAGSVRNNPNSAGAQEYVNNPKFAAVLKKHEADPRSAPKPIKPGAPASATSGFSPAIDEMIEALPMTPEQKEAARGMLQAVGGADDAAAAYFAKHNIGHFGKKPSKGLSLPKGAAMPEGLRIAASAGLSPLKDVGSLAGEATTAKTTATESQKTPGILDVLRSSAADTFNWATQGLSGSSMIDGALEGLNPFVADVIRPLTGAAGGQLDKWIGSGRDTVTDFLSGRPKSMPAVNDLAGSGATATVSRDPEESKHDGDMLDQLKQIVSRLEELTGVTKDNKPSSPTEAKHSAQPAPSQNIPLQGEAAGLIEMLRGLI
ncbi:TPA: lytic transglycosylase domain-containing protein [Enterobacter cloacae]